MTGWHGSQGKIKARDAALQEMIQAARVRADRTWRSRTKPLMRIDLHESSVLKSTGQTPPGPSPSSTRSSTPAGTPGGGCTPRTGSLRGSETTHVDVSGQRNLPQGPPEGGQGNHADVSSLEFRKANLS